MTPPEKPEEAPSALSRLERALAGFGEPKDTAPESEAPDELEPEFFDEGPEPDDEAEELPPPSSSVLDIASALAAVDQLEAAPLPAPGAEDDEEPEEEVDSDALLAAPPSDADAVVLAASAAARRAVVEPLDEEDDDLEEDEVEDEVELEEEDEDEDDLGLPSFEPVDLTPRYHDVADEPAVADEEPESEHDDALADDDPAWRRNTGDTGLPYFLVEDETPPPPPAAEPVTTVQDLREQLVGPQREKEMVKQDEAAKPPASIARTLAEIPVLLIVAALIAFLVKTFLAQAYYIPSGSMLPQLQIDDRVVVSKLAYKVHDPRRGDIIVFDDPRTGASTSKTDEGLLRKVGEGIGIVQPSTDEFIKRVIGLPGETVEGKNGHVYINGHKLIEPYLKPSVITSDFPKITVKHGHLWVMGDNRTGSADSRVFGQIKIDTIVGRALVKVWPFDHISFL